MNPEQDDHTVRDDELQFLCDECCDTGWSLSLTGDDFGLTRPCRKCLTPPERAELEASLS